MAGIPGIGSGGGTSTQDALATQQQQDAQAEQTQLAVGKEQQRNAGVMAAYTAFAEAANKIRAG